MSKELSKKDFFKDIVRRLYEKPKLSLTSEQYLAFITQNPLPDISLMNSKTRCININIISGNPDYSIIPIYNDPYPNKENKANVVISEDKWEDRISIPIRNYKCNHSDVLDLKLYSKENSHIKCPLCSSSLNFLWINPLSMYIDTGVLSIIENCEEIKMIGLPKVNGNTTRVEGVKCITIEEIEKVNTNNSGTIINKPPNPNSSK